VSPLRPLSLLSPNVTLDRWIWFLYACAQHFVSLRSIFVARIIKLQHPFINLRPRQAKSKRTDGYTHQSKTVTALSIPSQAGLIKGIHCYRFITTPTLKIASCCTCVNVKGRSSALCCIANPCPVFCADTTWVSGRAHGPRRPRRPWAYKTRVMFMCLKMNGIITVRDTSASIGDTFYDCYGPKAKCPHCVSLVSLAIVLYKHT